jgi:MoxR-like ATPase
MSSAINPAQPLPPFAAKDAAVHAHGTSGVGSAVQVQDAAAMARQKIGALITSIEAAIVGKRDTVKLILVGLLAKGHVLIEDVPGVGKTTLARALAKSIDCQFRRVQFTPDLLPSDIIGVSVFEQNESRFKFHPGPIFTNVVLADEINRTTPRTQAALLEAMNDFSVSVDGLTYALPSPFVVLATQNPIEYSGTYPLPEAQLDRFLLRVGVGYPDRDSERQVLKGQRLGHPIDAIKPVITSAEVLQLQDQVRHVVVEDALSDYILEIAARTREHKSLLLGTSPRGCLMLYRAAQAYALIDGRNFVRPDDIKRLALPVLGHRIIERGRDAGATRKDAESILNEILEAVPVPI